MNVVFLSPHFPPHYFRFCRNLKAAGANVLGVGDEPYENLSEDLRSALTEYYQVDNMHNYDALVRACGFFTHRYGKIDRLDSLNEYWLSTEARLRDDFNYACDIDIYRTWADLLVHNQTDLNYKRDYHCCYASRKDNQHYVHSHGEILSQYGAFMVQIESVPGVFSGALGDIGYIFRSKSLDEIMEIVRFIHQLEDATG